MKCKFQDLSPNFFLENSVQGPKGIQVTQFVLRIQTSCKNLNLLKNQLNVQMRLGWKFRCKAKIHSNT